MAIPISDHFMVVIEGCSYPINISEITHSGGPYIAEKKYGIHIAPSHTSSHVERDNVSIADSEDRINPLEHIDIPEPGNPDSEGAPLVHPTDKMKDDNLDVDKNNNQIRSCIPNHTLATPLNAASNEVSHNTSSIDEVNINSLPSMSPIIKDTHINVSQTPPDRALTRNYRDNTPSISDTNSSHTVISADVINMYDINHTVSKGTQLKLCKGLFSLHIKRGRGRPRKYKHTTKKRNQNIAQNRQAETGFVGPLLVDIPIPGNNRDLSIVPFYSKTDNTSTAYKILQDVMDMGLKPTCSTEQAIEHMLSAL